MALAISYTRFKVTRIFGISVPKNGLDHSSKTATNLPFDGVISKLMHHC